MKTAASKPLLTFASNATTVIFQSMIINDNALSFQNRFQTVWWFVSIACFRCASGNVLFSNISYDHICNSFHASKCYCLSVSALVANFSISSKFDHHLMPLALITNCHIARDCPILASRVFKNIFFWFTGLGCKRIREAEEWFHVRSSGIHWDEGKWAEGGLSH